MRINYSGKEIIAAEKGYKSDDNGNIIGPREKPLKLWKMPSGYLAFSVKDYRGKCINIHLHRFLAYEIYGMQIYEPGTVVRHLDGNHLNNSLDNLAIGTQSDNIIDIPKHKRSEHGRTADRTKYTLDEIKVFKDYKEEHTLKQTIKHFDISSTGKLRRLLDLV